MVDLHTGEVSIFFSPDKVSDAKAIWQAIIDAGFTPVKLKMPNESFTSAPEK